MNSTNIMIPARTHQPTEAMILKTSDQQSHHKISLEPGAKATVVEIYDQKSPTVMAKTEINILDHAELTWIRLQNQDTSMPSSQAQTEVKLGRDSRFKSLSMSFGSQNSQHHLAVHLTASGAEAEVYGLYAARDKQKNAHRIELFHEAPHTKSLQLYKSLLKDSAKGSFTGRIQIRPHCSGSQASQLNANLLLDPQAQAETQPELQIGNDDVRASHGATIGRLDPDQLFYLQTRGLSLEGARALLIQAFALELLEPFQQIDQNTSSLLINALENWTGSLK